MEKLSKEQIDKIFEESTDQVEAAIELYKIAFPNFEKLTSIDGHPQVSKVTNEYIFDKFIALDKQYHPTVINGGLWMNKGFGCSYPPDQDWIIDLSKCNPE